jgi:hypothetical protein
VASPFSLINVIKTLPDSHHIAAAAADKTMKPFTASKDFNQQ